jgi:uncharacterized protein (DUF1330 family)
LILRPSLVLLAAIGIWIAPIWSGSFAQTPGAAPIAQPLDPDHCDNKPVIMVVEGRTIDRDRLIAYGQAIRESGLYAKLGGYYLNSPRPIAVLEGTSPPERSVLMVRFPCYAHARTFWYSAKYQDEIIPLRSNPLAGTFTVTIHAEVPPPAYMADRIGSDNYLAPQVPEIVESIPRSKNAPPK